MMNRSSEKLLFWNQSPLPAFDAFVRSPDFQMLGKQRKHATNSMAKHKAMRDSSARIYTLMFGKFLRWCGEKNIEFLDLTSDQIMHFLEYGSKAKSVKGARDLNSSIRIRYLRILERVFQHLEITPNPAQNAIFGIYAVKNKKLRGEDADKAVLTETEQQAFMNALPGIAKSDNQETPPSGWKRRRDRAMQAMMLGAGLKVSEVIGIGTANVGTIDSEGCMPVTVSPGSTGGTSRWHETLIRQFAVTEIVNWYEERIKLAIPGPLFFPASLQGIKLDKATVYRQVKATFQRANISVSRLGGRTLRNSFAVRELKDGVTIEEVGEFMGHRKRKSTEHYLIKIDDSL
jgi:integrase/recombinase XerD